MPDVAVRYLASPNAKKAINTYGKKINPIVNPTPLPNEVDKAWIILMAKMMFVIGIINNRIHQRGLWMILNQI